METLHSKRNRLFFRMRNTLAFRRNGYQETGAESLDLSELELAMERKFGVAHLRPQLKPQVYQKNLATLWILDQMELASYLPPGNLQLVEPGCQDFSRLPSIRAYFKRWGRVTRVLGLEIDPYPILANLHSRSDLAHYYLSLPGGSSSDAYLAGNFFHHQDPSQVILSFYPFVSEHPALAWGLPADVGDARAWAQAFVTNLQKEGVALVVHQGKWEEEEFDAARETLPLTLLDRKEVNCPFYPLPHAACASLYRLSTSEEKNATVSRWKKNSQNF